MGDESHSLYLESPLRFDTIFHRILIDELLHRNYPSNIIERDKKCRGVLVWEFIILVVSDLHIFDADSVNGTRYCNEDSSVHMCVFLEALWVCSSFSWTTMHHVIAQ
ncbi:hypothetical protein TNCV_1502061 [Trichonephila clavipes]|uniref:Uncharacterized protein n=1 Tax=Trichonephila clavipes TaxID=2585209 RepID=A0A8X6V8S1_TRICX|nr:hypothetical protein TNCV_1502061 [Trichonephila clavipes]